MLVRRCAWHRRFHGYPYFYGVASWRGRRVTFTDGVCRRCAARVRNEWKLVDRRPPLVLALRVRRIAAAALSVALLAGTMLSPGPLSDLPSRLAATTPPTFTTDLPRPADSPLATPKRPRAKRIAKRPPPPAPREEDLAEMEAALALADPHPGFAEAEPVIETASAPEEPAAPISQIGTLEDELARAVIAKATVRLLLVAAAPPPEHAGTPIQAP
jgi:hypothetical protein